MTFRSSGILDVFHRTSDTVSEQYFLVETTAVNLDFTLPARFAAFARAVTDHLQCSVERLILGKQRRLGVYIEKGIVARDTLARY